MREGLPRKDSILMHFLRTAPEQLEKFFPVWMRRDLPELHTYRLEDIQKAIAPGRWQSTKTRECWYPIECSLDEFGLDVCFGYHQHPETPARDRFGWWTIEDLYSWHGGEENTLRLDPTWKPQPISKAISQ